MTKKNSTKWIISFGIVGLLLGAICYLTDSNISILNNLCLWVLGWVYLSIAFYLLIMKVEVNNLKGYALSLGLAAVICTLIVLFFPIKYGDVLDKNMWERNEHNTENVIITPLEDVNCKSTSAEIFIDSIMINYKKVDVNEIDLPEGWQVLDGYIYAADARTAKMLTISIPKGSTYEIVFGMTEASGTIEYSVGNYNTIIDLYNESRSSSKINPLDLWGKVVNDSQFQRLLYYFIYFLLLYIYVSALIYKGIQRHEMVHSILEKGTE